MTIYTIKNDIINRLNINYILSYFSEDIPFIVDILIGIFVSVISIPVAIIGWIWILRLCRVF